MPFNSLTYFLFLPVVYLTFCLVGARARWCVLLAASLLFYAALQVPYLPAVLALAAMATYGFGIRLDQAESPGAKRALLVGGVVANLSILAALKYLPFIAENLKSLANLLSLDFQPQAKVLVAIGVSYYVFQAISYLIDIYLELEKPERHFGYFALYLCFFPKLLQGPIERAGELIPQLKKKYEFDYDNLRFALLLIIWGLFKKVVIADRLGLYVDPVYNNVRAFTGLPLLLATYLYAFQIYLDFSGYTDMALGSALLFNVRLTQNFDSPYLATSVADFWRRWHISFSRWILDYIFKPLQMQWRNLQSLGTAAALVVAFLISGLWHGASWGFVIWGGLHGLYMACSVLSRPWRKKAHKALRLEKTRWLRAWQIFVTFNLVSAAWVFFRAKDPRDALYVLTHVFSGVNRLGSGFLLSQGKLDLIFIVLCFVALFGSRPNFVGKVSGLPVYGRWFVYYALAIAFYVLQVPSKKFIYFQF